MFSEVKCCIAGGGWGNTASRLRPAAHLPDHSNRAWSLVGTRDILAETMRDTRREERHRMRADSLRRGLLQMSRNHKVKALCKTKHMYTVHICAHIDTQL